MQDFLTDNSDIQLQENIPLSDQDLQHILIQQEALTKTVPIILGGATLFTMLLASLFIKDMFASFKYYDYILFAFGGLALFAFGYLISLIIITYDNRNWRKDKLNGKNKLKSVVINRDKTEYAEYLTFAGPHINDKIRIRVKKEDYSRYEPGAKVLVTYLKYSREALEIIEPDKE